MMLALMNPDLFDIEQSKQMGIWPPSNVVAHGIFPYIQRLKQNDLTILDVGVMKGENSYLLLEKDTKKKIKLIYGLVSCKDGFELYNETKDICKKNMENVERFQLIKKATDMFDVVCIHSESDLDNNLKTYYKHLKTNGIFCGNDHGTARVKEALSKFRRENRIGTPINVANDCWFWIKR